MSSEGQTQDQRFRGPLSLEGQWTIAFCGLLFAFGAAAIGLDIAADNRQARDHAGAIAEDRVNLIAKQSGAALAVSDLATLETVVSALADERGALGVRVARTSSDVLFSTLPADDAALQMADRLAVRAGREGRTLTRIDGAHVLAAAPVRVDGAVVATAALLASREELGARHRGSSWEMWLLLIGMMTVTAPLGIYLSARVARPVRRLTAFLETFDERRLADRLVMNDGVESRRLADACNRMAQRLQDSTRRLQRKAYCDASTGLPNHERFVADVTDTLAAGHADVAAIFVVRLDRLDRIFDAVGQDAGDELLARIVGRFLAAVRAIDRMVRTDLCADAPSQLARLRGGEFGVIVPRLRGPEEAARFAQLLASALNQPFDWREHKLVLGAVIGAALLPQDGADADTAIRHAMLAMSAAKSDAGRMRFFTRALDREANAQLSLEREMRAALDRNEFRAFFQPKIDFMTGRVIGAEALARWIRPDRTMVSPGRFIPAAEENGLIGSISEVIARDAFWKAAAWAREGFPFSVAINISPLQFADERFTDRMLRMMAEAGVAPNRVELEITESVALENPERAMRMLDPLRAEGVKISLDDFGCGHSSLASLTRLPFDIIKIDQQFVRALAKDRHAPAIIEMILAMAAALDYEVVAEGVETEEEAEFLRRRGCQIGQGFLYGAAMPSDEFLRFNRERSDAGIRAAAAGVAQAG